MARPNTLSSNKLTERREMSRKKNKQRKITIFSVLILMLDTRNVNVTLKVQSALKQWANFFCWQRWASGVGVVREAWGSYNPAGVSAAHIGPQRTRAETIFSCMKMDVIQWVRNHGAICWLAEIRTPRHCLASPTISPQSHIPLLTTLLSFLFLFLFCRSLFKKNQMLETQYTKHAKNLFKTNTQTDTYIYIKRYVLHVHMNIYDNVSYVCLFTRLNLFCALGANRIITSFCSQYSLIKYALWNFSETEQNIYTFWMSSQ